jgi:hypothetical protein
MMLSGTAYQLPPLAPLTDGTVSGYSLTGKATHSVPTPTASDHIERQNTTGVLNFETNKAVTLDRWVQMWPTPNARTLGGGEYQDPEKIKVRWSKGRQKNLSEAVKLFPTPTSRDWKDGSAPRFREGVQQFDTLGRAVGGQLNPMWVEWLMGFPLGWTDLSNSETP